MIWLLCSGLELVVNSDNEVALADNSGVPFLLVFSPSPVRTRYRTASGGL